MIVMSFRIRNESQLKALNSLQRQRSRDPVEDMLERAQVEGTRVKPGRCYKYSIGCFSVVFRCTRLARLAAVFEFIFNGPLFHLFHYWFQ